MGLGLLPTTKPVIIIIDRIENRKRIERGKSGEMELVGSEYICDGVETLTYCRPINEPTRAALDLSSADCFH